MDFINLNPIKSIYVIECQDWGYHISKNTSQSFSTIKIDNKLLLNFSYIVSSKYQDFIYVAVEPAYDIYNVEVKMHNLVEFYDLENKQSKIIDKLLPEYFYFFFINAGIYSETKVTIIMDKIDDNPFNDIDIYEYKGRNDSFNSYKKASKYKYSTITKENKLEIYFNYSSSSNQIEKIGFILKPLYNINNMIILIEVEGGIHKVDNDNSKSISNMMPDTSYYFYTDVRQNQKLNISFNINSSDSSPISYVNIYENSEIKDLSRLKTATIPISTEKINNTLFASFSYLVSKDYCKYIFIEIKPSSIINYINY